MKYIQWITQSFENALASGLKDESAWNLTTKLGECVFQTLNEVRSGVKNSFDLKHPKNLAATIWLTVGRTHDAMELFIVKDFKNHSAISGEYIQFVVQNNNSDELPTYKASINCLEKKFKKLNTKMGIVSKTATTALNKVKLEEGEMKNSTEIRDTEMPLTMSPFHRTPMIISAHLGRS